MYKTIHNKRKVVNSKDQGIFWLSLTENQPLEESWNINIQAIKGRHECRAAGERRARPSPSVPWVCSTALCWESHQAHSARPADPLMAAAATCYFTSPRPALWNAPVPGIHHTCVLPSAVHGTPSLGVQTGAAGKRVPQRWEKGRPHSETCANITWSPLTLVHAKHIERWNGTPPAAKTRVTKEARLTYVCDRSVLLHGKGAAFYVGDFTMLAALLPLNVSV